jgi:hypothetical protein
MDKLMSEFLAKGGKVSKIAAGKTTHNMTNADWRRQTRLTKTERGMRSPTADELEMMAERKHEQVREAAHMGGRDAAIEALNSF